MKIYKNGQIYHLCRYKSTLLIPDYLLSFFNELVYKHGNMRSLLGFLVSGFQKNKYKIYFEKDISSTIKYQEKSLNLHREDFRPFEEDWINMKLLATSHNLSICAFFILLVQMELAGAMVSDKKTDGVPPKFPRINLHQALTLYSIPRFTRILHLRL